MVVCDVTPMLWALLALLIYATAPNHIGDAQPKRCPAGLRERVTAAPTGNYQGATPQTTLTPPPPSATG